MSVTNEMAIPELRAGNLADPNHHLKPGGRDEVIAEIERLRSLGVVAHVLVVDRGDPLEQLMSAWDALDYDADRDLLLVYDTHDWVARGGGSTVTASRGSSRLRSRTSARRMRNCSSVRSVGSRTHDS